MQTEGVPAPGDAARTLAAEAARASSCTLCRLRDARTHVIHGEGPASADVLLVLEQPGYHDDRAGAPLVAPGAAGALDDLLRAAGIGREDVYVAPLVKCRPPRGRSPFPDEVESCEGWLFRQVQAVRPRVVLACGNNVVRLLTGRPCSMRHDHGVPRPVTVAGHRFDVVPIYHPAAAATSSRLLAELVADGVRLRALLAGDAPHGAMPASRPAPTAAAPAASDDGPAQLTMLGT
jgi:DNA polymerase